MIIFSDGWKNLMEKYGGIPNPDLTFVGLSDFCKRFGATLVKRYSKNRGGMLGQYYTNKVVVFQQSKYFDWGSWGYIKVLAHELGHHFIKTLDIIIPYRYDHNDTSEENLAAYIKSEQLAEGFAYKICCKWFSRFEWDKAMFSSCSTKHSVKAYLFLNKIPLELTEKVSESLFSVKETK